MLVLARENGFICTHTFDRATGHIGPPPLDLQHQAPSAIANGKKESLMNKVKSKETPPVLLAGKGKGKEKATTEPLAPLPSTWCGLYTRLHHVRQALCAYQDSLCKMLTLLLLQCSPLDESTAPKACLAATQMHSDSTLHGSSRRLQSVWSEDIGFCAAARHLPVGRPSLHSMWLQCNAIYNS